MTTQRIFSFLVALLISGFGFLLASHQFADWSLLVVGVTLMSWTCLEYAITLLKQKGIFSSSNLVSVRSNG